MKRISLLSLVLFLLLSVLASAQFDYFYQGRATVGHQPVAVYNFDIGNMPYNPVVYCAGKDLNYNGIMDEGDEAPSLWALPYPILVLFLNIDLQLSAFDAKKLIDLEFKMPVLPVRNFWDKNEKKLYVINSNNISKISSTSKGDFIDSVVVEKVVNVTASAVSSSGDFLYISVRPSFTDPGYVLVYDKIKKVYTDTIPSGISVQQTIPTGAGDLFIISEGTFGKGGGKFQVVDVSKAKHTIIKEMDIDGTPSHIDYSESENSVYITCNTSNQIKKIFLNNYAIDSLTLALGTYDGPRESIYQTEGVMNGMLLTSAYDGNVYIHQGKKLMGKFDAKAKPEGFMAIGKMFFIATPYLDAAYNLDSNVTIYTEPFDDVAENPAQEGYYVYPNPSVGMINIESPEEFNLSTAVLYNSMGEKISNLQISGEAKNISLKDLGLSPGAYFVKISNGRKNLTLPFVIK
jgi:hypothetical protein